MDIMHPDLSENLVFTYDEVNDSALTGDPVGHGTHVAGIIAAEANNFTGIAGVSFNADLMVIDVFDGQYAYTSDITDGFNRAVSNGAEVINMSLGAYGTLSGDDLLLSQAIQNGAANGVVTVCAGGNGDDFGNPVTDSIFPGDLDACISVVPLDSSDERPEWADYNQYKDISAPGIYILSTIPSSYGYKTGSSMAAPVVSGVVAMILAQNPDLTVDQVKNILYETANNLGTSGRDDYYGYGKVNAYQALVTAANLDLDHPAAASVTALPASTYGSTFTLSANGVTDASGVASVRFAVWSKTDQSDLVWYTGATADHSTWTVTADISNHSNNRGTYTIHAYAADTEGNQGFIGAASASVLTDTSAPTASSVTASVAQTYGNTFQIYAMGLSDSTGVASVEFAVWSKSDQSDLVWYSGADFKNTNWGAAVNTANHSYNRGTYTIHAYATDIKGNRGFIGATTVNALKDTSPPAATSITAPVTQTYGNTFQVNAMGLSDPAGVAGVRFAVWSKADQSDLVWYNGMDFKNTNWGITVNTANHSYNRGTYTIHVYAVDTQGNTGYIGATTVKALKDTSAPAAKSISPAVTQTYGNTFAVNAMGLSDSSGVASVRFAVWSKSDQSDIVWYNGTDFKNTNWGVTVNTANHSYNRGTYNIHVYATDINGNTGFIGATTVKTLKETAAPTAASITASVSQTYHNTFAVNAMGLLDTSGVASVRFAVWSKADQSDLVWYSGTDFKNTNWGITVNTANHSYNRGTYTVHAYAADNQGNTGYIGATTVKALKDTAAPTATSITPPVSQTYSNTFDVYAMGVKDSGSGVANVKFAVWSRSDQSDLVWYNGIDFNNTNWGITVDISNHSYHKGTYQIHVYAADKQGNTGFVGATAVQALGG